MEKVTETKVLISDQEIDKAVWFHGKISACKMSSCPGIMQAKEAFAVFCLLNSIWAKPIPSNVKVYDTMTFQLFFAVS